VIGLYGKDRSKRNGKLASGIVNRLVEVQEQERRNKEFKGTRCKANENRLRRSVAVSGASLNLLPSLPTLTSMKNAMLSPSDPRNNVLGLVSSPFIR